MAEYTMKQDEDFREAANVHLDIIRSFHSLQWNVVELRPATTTTSFPSASYDKNLMNCNLDGAGLFKG